MATKLYAGALRRVKVPLPSENRQAVSKARTDPFDTRGKFSGRPTITAVAAVIASAPKARSVPISSVDLAGPLLAQPFV